MAGITAEDVIKMALGANQDVIKRRQKNSGYIQQGLQNIHRGHVEAGQAQPHGEGGHGDSPYAADNPYGIEPELFRRIQRLNEMSPFGPNTVSIGSGYRSYEEQQRLYDAYLRGEGNLAARPGQSNHNHGTAADLRYASDQAREWVHSVARDLGLHFPVRGENWHVERFN